MIFWSSEIRISCVQPSITQAFYTFCVLQIITISLPSKGSYVVNKKHYTFWNLKHYTLRRSDELWNTTNRKKNENFKMFVPFFIFCTGRINFNFLKTRKNKSLCGFLKVRFLVSINILKNTRRDRRMFWKDVFFLFIFISILFFLRKRFLEPQEFKKQGFRGRGDLLHPEN